MALKQGQEKQKGIDERKVDCCTQEESLCFWTYKYYEESSGKFGQTVELSHYPQSFSLLKISASSGKCEFEILQNKVTKQQDGTC